MRYSLFSAISLILVLESQAFACHPVLKCVEQSGSAYVAYFGFEGGESNVAIGNSNKFYGASGCIDSGRNCGQGTKFPNNGPYEADYFGSDSAANGKQLLPVSFNSSVTWTLSGSSVTASKTSKPCTTPTRTATATSTSTRTSTRTATPTITSTNTATSTLTFTASPTSTHSPTRTHTSTPTRTATRSNTPQPTVAFTHTAVPTVYTPPVFTATFVPTIPNKTPTASATGTTVISIVTQTPASTPNQTPDCEGVPGGKKEIDCCGVCGGDGTSCPELCKEIDNRPSKKKLTKEIKSLNTLISKRISQELKCNKNSKDAIKRKKELSLIKSELKLLLLGFDPVIKLCDTIYCKKTSYEELTLELKSSMKKLILLDKLSQRGALNACCRGTACRGIGIKGPDRNKNINSIISQFPNEACD